VRAMASEFDNLLRSTDLAVDRLYGEPFTFLPMTPGVNAGAAPDTLRDAVIGVVACFWDEERIIEEGRSRRSATNPFLWIRDGLDIRVGDRFVREVDGRVYQVTGIRPTLARKEYDVVEIVE